MNNGGMIQSNPWFYFKAGNELNYKEKQENKQK